MTLLRASTGEAWNEIMHNRIMDEVDYLYGGTWYTPFTLYEWQTKYDVLKDKCLVEKQGHVSVEDKAEKHLLLLQAS